MDTIDRIVFMKVGSHAGETWEQILERKRREVERTGYSFWGYGGPTCHPTNHVQPFARLSLSSQGTIGLVMMPIDSRAAPEIAPASEFSKDGIIWEPIPNDIRVLGSRYALVLEEISEADLELDLGSYEVAVGPSRGRTAEEYIRGRVDKACLVKKGLERDLPMPQAAENIVPVKFTANLRDPFAVFLR